MFWGRRVSGSSSFGFVEFWVRQVLGSSSFALMFWGTEISHILLVFCFGFFEVWVLLL